jgi:hypothetical protein
MIVSLLREVRVRGRVWLELGWNPSWALGCSDLGHITRLKEPFLDFMTLPGPLTAAQADSKTHP